jgi:hypothetical protein
MGTGAIAAGPPTMARSQQPVPKISIPVAKQPPLPLSDSPSMNLEHIRNQSSQRVSSILIEPRSESSLAAPVMNQRNYHYGVEYIARRVFAYVLDTLLNSILFVSAIVSYLMKQESSYDLLANPSVIFVTFLLWLAFHWSLTTVQELVFRTTIGKRILRLSLTGGTFGIFLRAILFIPSFSLGGLGIVWSVFDSQKRCLHDRLSGARPVVLY